MSADAALASVPVEEAPYELVNIHPKNTGLPMVVYASFRAGSPHDARLKVSMSHGDRMDLNNVAVVGLRPTPRLIHGSLSSADLKQVTLWIEKNRAALIDFWDEKIDGVDFIQALKKL